MGSQTIATFGSEIARSDVTKTLIAPKLSVRHVWNFVRRWSIQFSTAIQSLATNRSYNWAEKAGAFNAPQQVAGIDISNNKNFFFPLQALRTGRENYMKLQIDKKTEDISNVGRLITHNLLYTECCRAEISRTFGCQQDSITWRTDRTSPHRGQFARKAPKRFWGLWCFMSSVKGQIGAQALSCSEAEFVSAGCRPRPAGWIVSGACVQHL